MDRKCGETSERQEIWQVMMKVRKREWIIMKQAEREGNMEATV